MGDVRDKTQATAGNRMTRSEIDAFLAVRQDARLATHREDGHIQLTPVWYWWEDGRVYFTLGETRVHMRNLRRDPRATLLMDRDDRLTQGWQAGAQAVMLAGTCEIVSDPAVVARYEELMGGQYLGEQAHDPDFLATVDGETRYLVVLTPALTVSWDYDKA